MAYPSLGVVINDSESFRTLQSRRVMTIFIPDFRADADGTGGGLRIDKPLRTHYILRVRRSQT
jgi:hypothetical protein